VKGALGSVKRGTRGAAHGRGFAAVLALAAWVAILGATTSTARAPAGAEPVHRSVLAGRPGYVPLVDPESMAVVLGRRTNAPLVQQRFRGGARSLNDLGRRVTRYLELDQRDSLLALCVGEDDFRDILWREFPQSRPVTGLQWQDGWTILHARLRSGCLEAAGNFGGQPYEFVRFERLARPDSLFKYRNFTLHNGLIMVVRSPAGQIERWNWLRSVAERRGAFKIYSTTD